MTLPDINGDGIDTDGDGNADDGIGQYVIQDGGTDLTEAESKSVEDSIMNPPARGSGPRYSWFLHRAEPRAAPNASC